MNILSDPWKNERRSLNVFLTSHIECLILHIRFSNAFCPMSNILLTSHSPIQQSHPKTRRVSHQLQKSDTPILRVRNSVEDKVTLKSNKIMHKYHIFAHNGVNTSLCQCRTQCNEQTKDNPDACDGIYTIIVTNNHHDDVIKWKHFPCYWRFVRGIHRWLVNSPHKSQWRGSLMFSFIYAWINGSVNNREAGDLRRHRAHYDVIIMTKLPSFIPHMIYIFCHHVKVWQCSWFLNTTISSGRSDQAKKNPVTHIGFFIVFRSFATRKSIARYLQSVEKLRINWKGSMFYVIWPTIINDAPCDLAEFHCR